jgi:hypothetical protein
MKKKIDIKIAMPILGILGGLLLGFATEYLRPTVSTMINDFNNSMISHRFAIVIFMVAFDAIFFTDFIKMIRNTKNKLDNLELKAMFMAFFTISLTFPLMAIDGSIFQGIFFWSFIILMGPLFLYTNGVKGIIGPFVYREIKKIIKTIRKRIDKSLMAEYSAISQFNNAHT